jgi:adenylate cyclase
MRRAACLGNTQIRLTCTHREESSSFTVYGALGIVTALAARLSDQAQGGQIRLSQRAHAALEGRVDARLVGEFDVKGFARPVQAFELLGVLDATTG